MKPGTRVKHPILGEGIILEHQKYGGVLVDYSNKEGVLIRVSHVSKLEKIDE